MPGRAGWAEALICCQREDPMGRGGTEGCQGRRGSEESVQAPPSCIHQLLLFLELGAAWRSQSPSSALALPH